MTTGQIFAPAKSAFPPSMVVKPYYRYECIHALCNAHHLRELERAWVQDDQQWAKEIQALRIELAKEVEDTGGWLPPDEAERWHKRYRNLLKKQKPNARLQMKANGREKGAGSNDRKPETCWRDCETSSKMSCASWMWRTSPSPTTRVRTTCA